MNVAVLGVKLLKIITNLYNALYRMYIFGKCVSSQNSCALIKALYGELKLKGFFSQTYRLTLSATNRNLEITKALCAGHQLIHERHVVSEEQLKEIVSRNRRL